MTSYFQKGRCLKKMIALFVESPGKTAVDGFSRGKYYSKISCVIRKGRDFFFLFILRKDGKEGSTGINYRKIVKYIETNRRVGPTRWHEKARKRMVTRKHCDPSMHGQCYQETLPQQKNLNSIKK